ncbi:hypothetical protein DLAC_09367 [Tieghemostelium lacteum]|uniref:Proline dehydrogenase n=1 Tax=Tieghemostelium lacteum TaxID=361077 RepID=A0A151Z9V8_TIELA|nr:hypothetical protein DLAC_09367 [Tieghemostelium lacteum]|eukprot:KYQ90730.1 hypothetical protein DLAC_09367 [Tieghemostelium lacteum]
MIKSILPITYKSLYSKSTFGSLYKTPISLDKYHQIKKNNLNNKFTLSSISNISQSQFTSSFNKPYVHINSTSTPISKLFYTTLNQQLPKPTPQQVIHEQNQNNNSNGNGKNKKSSHKFKILGIVGVLSISYYISELISTINDVDEEELKRMYSSKTSAELIFNYIILKLCSFSFISDNSQALLELSEKLGLEKVSSWFIKKTFFKQFCAGETLEETSLFKDKLNQQGIGAILDYSVEDSSGTNEGFDNVAEQIIKTIQISSNNPNLSFSCLKVTGLANSELLEKMNQFVNEILLVTERLPVEILENPMDFYANLNKYIQSGKKKSVVSNANVQPFTPEQLRELSLLMNRLDSIFKECQSKQVPILVDAEQSYYQQAIHHLTMAFSLKYNKERPLIYNTYQMYLANGYKVLTSHLEISKANQFKLGAKIVRGAYMVSERERAARLNYPDPILPNITETHHSYNQAIELLLRENPTQNKVGIMIASHNVESALFAMKLIKQYNLPSSHPNIQFGQLFGMADFLTYQLVAQNQRVFKYVPYGPVHEVLPYLVRRMHENKGFIGSNSEKELSFLRKELKRRFNFFKNNITTSK